MSNRKFNWDLFWGFLIVLAAFLLIFTDGLNVIQYRMLYYDDAYNATVAANFIRYGEYRVSFPDDITFYNPITTGITAILPAALLFKLFGISSFTASLTPLLYGVFNLWLFWYLLSICLASKSKHNYSLSAVFAVLLILACYVYQMICENLWGETASCTFQLLAAIFMRKHLSNHKLSYMAWSGAMVAMAFLTKSAMIFFMTVWFTVILIEAFYTRSITKKAARSWYLGWAGGFIFTDAFKFYQLGGFIPYLRWWKHEWINMMTQSAGHGDKPSIPVKIESLSTLFYNNCYFSLAIIGIAAVLYFIIVYRSHKQKKQPDHDLLSMSIYGVGGASLLVYYILFGGNGLMHRTRLSIYILFIKMLIVFLLCLLIIHIVKQIRNRNNTIFSRPKVIGQSILAIVTCCLLFPYEYLNRNINMYIEKTDDYSYEQKLVTEFLGEVDALPEDATLYVAAWWHVPHVTLYLDRKMTSIYEKKPVDYNKGYFLVGISIEAFNVALVEEVLNAHLVRIDTSEVDYSQLPPYPRQDLEIYAIYKVEPKEAIIEELVNEE